MILPNHWDPATKTVKSVDPEAKTYNRKLTNLMTDLYRVIDLVQAKEGLATPDAVWKLLEGPKAFPDKTKLDKRINLEFSLKLDQLVKEYVVFQKKSLRHMSSPSNCPPAARI